MTITVRQLFDELRNTQLTDAEAITWPDSVMLMALNSALTMLVLMRPDATAVTTLIDLAAGTRQNIPQDGIRFLKLLRNVQTNDAIGRAIRFVDMNSLDAIDPNWHNMQATTAIHEYGFDKNLPREFYVYPAAAVGMRVSCSIASSRPDCPRLLM